MMPEDYQRLQVLIRGTVQGVGFRPFVWRLAHELGLCGWVGNDDQGVQLEVQGQTVAIETFLARLKTELPPLASIATLHVKSLALLADEKGFAILVSQSAQSKRATVPPDVAMCGDCERELLDPQDRRFRYPFLNCTNCGPRFTILAGLPYDRAQTTMRSFKMCVSCRVEYDSPDNRRFHAQPNACSTCGPQVTFEFNPARATIAGAEAIEAARQSVLSGRILAVKGVGGFHLACDATNEVAVTTLRQRKRRPFKPLAVMVADLETAHRLAELSSPEAELLTSPARPIVLLTKRSPARLATEVAPENPQLGIMLAYSPLHRLLVAPGEVWVMTSGNLADEPICYENETAVDRLKNLCDGFLMHDRPIESVCDDSVVRVYRAQPLPIRRSRGYCPLPIELANLEADRSPPSVLAVGGEIKTAACLTVGDQAILGQHIGDMGNAETLAALHHSVENLLKLYQVLPTVVAADLHPGYLSQGWAKARAAQWNIPLVTVQHHHAHAVALSTEHGLNHQPIIACVFDGTGYGPDGAIWGGEWLISSPRDYLRFARLAYTSLPGGDAAIERPAKIALAQLNDFGIQWERQLPCVEHFRSSERTLLQQQLRRSINTIRTSSMGRLFDAVAAICGVRQRVHYEGQAAIELEHLATRFVPRLESMDSREADQIAYPVDWKDEGIWVWNYQTMLQSIVSDQLSGIAATEIAARFHATVVMAATEICYRAREQTSINVVGLSGGVFQNLLLSEMLQASLERLGFQVLTHRRVPPNDGGLALGQAIIARAQASA